jgi:predicted metalloprotease with PDZ domain
MTFTGAGNEDRSRCVRDFEAIVRQGEELFGSLPYDSYLMVIHLLASSRGGLEHRDSAICDYPRLGFSGNDYEEFVGLVCHEYFHTWNVKRIKPAAFLPYDYEKECYTRLLWAMEGTTSYYEWLLLRRAGLLSAERYLARLADKINRLEEQPGRLRKPLADASFDTWIKAYRPDEHSANSTISYYEKGELVALLLDLEIRKGTGGSRSYDDLMRLLHERYGSRGVGIPEDGYRPAAEEIAGRPLAEFWRHYIEGTDEIDWASALAQAGLAVAQVDANPKVGWIGVRTKSDGGRLLLETVLDGGPAHRAGLAAGDEVVALDRFRVDPDSFARRIEQLGGGSRTEVTFFREGVQKSVRLGVGARPRKIGKIAFDPTAPEKARAATRDWLRGPEERKARR